jgi:hypothetical protein
MLSNESHAINWTADMEFLQWIIVQRVHLAREVSTGRPVVNSWLSRNLDA